MTAKREDKTHKIKPGLIPPEMIIRLADHYTSGGIVHGDWNWLNMDEEQVEQCKQSARRHFLSWQMGENNEDHAMACVWNIFAYEYHKTIKNQFSDLIEHIGKK